MCPVEQLPHINSHQGEQQRSSSGTCPACNCLKIEPHEIREFCTKTLPPSYVPSNKVSPFLHSPGIWVVPVIERKSTASEFRKKRPKPPPVDENDEIELVGEVLPSDEMVVLGDNFHNQDVVWTNSSSKDDVDEQPGIVVDKLMGKLYCPICYRNFRRTKRMIYWDNKFGTPKKHKANKMKLNQLVELKEELSRYERAILGTTTTPSPQVIKSTIANKPIDDSIVSETLSLVDETHDGQTEEETMDLRVSRCGHVFCAECLSTLSYKKKNCPICSQPLGRFYPLYL